MGLTVVHAFEILAIPHILVDLAALAFVMSTFVSRSITIVSRLRALSSVLEIAVIIVLVLRTFVMLRSAGIGLPMMLIACGRWSRSANIRCGLGTS